MTSDVRQRLILLVYIGLALLIPIIWSFYWPADAVVDVKDHPLGVDFANIWAGPRIAAQHGIMTLFNWPEYQSALDNLFGRNLSPTGWSYPPYMVLLANPLSLLPYQVALLLWTLAGIALYSAVVLHGLAPNARRTALLFLLLSPAAVLNVVVGQNGFFTAGLLLGGLILLERRPWLSGVLFGLLAIKPHLAVLVPIALAAAGAWRAIASAALTVVLLAAAALSVWGIDPWIPWWTKATAQNYALLAQFKLFHTYMMPSVFASARALGLPPDMANIVQIIFALPVAMATAWAFRATHDVALRALVLASGAMLVSPYVFNYDMTAVTAAILWVMLSSRPGEDAQRSRAIQAWIFGAAWVLPSAIWWLRAFHIDIWSVIIACVFVVAVLRIRSATQQVEAASLDSHAATVLDAALLKSLRS